jgi:Gpi18-like mannosyltransferase
MPKPESRTYLSNPSQAGIHKKQPRRVDRLLLAISVFVQIVLALFLGHAYDTRILMATGYLVGTAQNPYIAQNLSAVFHNNTFQGITTLGYPPPWALVLGLIYLFTYKILPNFYLYNLAIKLPIIAANIGLAYIVRQLLNKAGAQEKISRQAWIFLLFNPFLLLTSSAWGQFDPLVALLALLALYSLSQAKLTVPAILLALAISFKPTALPLIPVVFIYLAGRSWRRTLYFFAVLSLSMLLFCVAPFWIFGWDPSQILMHWNSQFVVGGGLSFMTFLEYVKWTYQLPGGWAFLGWLWLPALGIATYTLKAGIKGFDDLLKKSVALILVFYLCRAWLSETNINLILPLVLILVSLNALDRRALAALWILPLIFSFFNTSLAQLFFPSLPGLMNTLLKWSLEFSTVRYVFRTVVVAAWLAAGWWMVWLCLGNVTTQAATGAPASPTLPPKREGSPISLRDVYPPGQMARVREHLRIANRPVYADD